MTDISAVKGFTDTWDCLFFRFYPQNTAKPLAGLSNWAVEKVNSLNSRGVIPHLLQNSFKKPIRRDEFVALILAAYISIYTSWEYAYLEGVTPPFVDIGGSPYKASIAVAHTHGFVNGTSATKFTPNGLLTQEQAAKLAFSLMEKFSGATLGSDKPNFADNAKISSWAIPYVAFWPSFHSDKVLLAYADYFDVSLDYICGRTYKSEGKLFSARPNVGGDNEEIRQFIEMCFDPQSKMSVRLKDTLYRMMAGGDGNADEQ